MVAMAVVEHAVDQEVSMVAMRNRLGPVSLGTDDRLTGVGILGGDVDLMVVDVVPMGMMQMPVMQVVDMVAVLNLGVAASRAMDMRVVVVGLTDHGSSSEIKTKRLNPIS